MANVEVKIQLQDTVEDTIKRIRVEDVENVTSRDEVPVNNVSIYHPMKNAMNWQEGFLNLSTKNNGVNMKSWATGSLSLADGYVGGSNTKLMRQGGYNGYVFGAVPENKQFELTIRVSGSDIDSIIIYGDKEANQFPTKAYLDSNSSEFIYSDDPVWAIKFPNAHTNHSITFLEWNRANYNACITFVAVLKNHLKFDSSWISNLESLSQSTSTPEEIYYGTLPSNGDLELIDKEKELKDYINDGIVEPTNLKLELFVNGNKIQNHLATNIDYMNNSFNVIFNMSNILDKYDFRKYGGRLLTLKSSHTYNYSKTLWDLFEENMLSWGMTQDQISLMTSNKIICGNDNIERTVKKYFQNIKLIYPYINAGTYRETLDKYCQVAQLQLLENNNGDLKFVNARPLATEEELDNVINIPLKNQMNSLEMSLIKKNKYDGVNITYNDSKRILENVTTLNKSMYQNLPAPETEYFDEDLQVFTFVSAEDIDPLWGLNPDNRETVTNIEYISTIYNPEETHTFALYKYVVEDKHNFCGIKLSGTVKRFMNLAYQYVGSSTQKLGLLYPLQEFDIFGVDYIKVGRNAFDGGFDYGANLKPNKIHKSITEEGQEYNFFDSAKNGINVYNVLEENGEITSYFILPIREVDLSRDRYAVQGEEFTSYGLLSPSYDLNISNDIIREKFVNYEYGETNNVASLSKNNELLQKFTTYVVNDDIFDPSIPQVIAETILEDYKNGLYSSTIQINCSDFYNLYGDKVKDWQKGEIINIHDIVRIEGNDRFWRVTGREFIKQGVPLINLELQEIKQ